jgi:hypothetical protein
MGDVQCDPADTFTAYAVTATRFVSVVLDNKNAITGMTATANLGTPVKAASAICLQGTPAGSLSPTAASARVSS